MDEPGVEGAEAAAELGRVGWGVEGRVGGRE